MDRCKLPKTIALILVASLVWTSNVFAQTKSAGSCEQAIGSAEFLRLQELSDGGKYGGAFRDGLEKFLVEPECSTESVKKVMLAFGFREVARRDFDETHEHFEGYIYDRIDAYCRAPRQFLRRLFYSCGGVIKFYFRSSSLVGVQGNASI